MREAGRRMLDEARSLRTAFPDRAALRGVAISTAPPDDGDPALAAALTYLRDEMVLVRDGRAGTLGVLDDEAANVESLLART